MCVYQDFKEWVYTSGDAEDKLLEYFSAKELVSPPLASNEREEAHGLSNVPYQEELSYNFGDVFTDNSVIYKPLDKTVEKQLPAQGHTCLTSLAAQLGSWA